MLLLINHREWIEKSAERVGPSDLEDDANRVIFEALIADPELVALPEGTKPEAVDRFEELNADPETLADPARVFDDTVAKIEGNRISRRLDALEAEIRGSGTGEQRRLIRDKENLMKERQALPVDWRRSGKALSNLGRTRQGGEDRK